VRVLELAAASVLLSTSFFFFPRLKSDSFILSIGKQIWKLLKVKEETK
jgi:hypothetical protein